MRADELHEMDALVGVAHTGQGAEFVDESRDQIRVALTEPLWHMCHHRPSPNEPVHPA